MASMNMKRRDFIMTGGMAAMGLAFGLPGKSSAGADEIIEQHRRAGAYIKIDGLNIFYRRGGPERGAPVVMTHGIPRSSFLYRKMIPKIAEHRPVRAWDLYGFGLSDKPADQSLYTFPKYEECFAKFMDALKIERAHLVCHDVGGPFTIGWAVKNPDRVASLTILNTTVFFKGFNLPGMVGLAILSPMWLQRLVVSDEEYGDTVLRYIKKKALYNPDALSGDEAEAFKKLLVRDGGRWSVSRVAKGYLRGGFRHGDELRSFKRPALIMWGKHDPFCTVKIAHIFKEHLPHAKLHIVEQASHFLQEDQPDEVCRVLLDFIESVE